MDHWEFGFNSVLTLVSRWCCSRWKQLYFDHSSLLWNLLPDSVTTNTVSHFSPSHHHQDSSQFFFPVSGWEIHISLWRAWKTTDTMMERTDSTRPRMGDDGRRWGSRVHFRLVWLVLNHQTEKQNSQSRREDSKGEKLLYFFRWKQHKNRLKRDLLSCQQRLTYRLICWETSWWPLDWWTWPFISIIS